MTPRTPCVSLRSENLWLPRFLSALDPATVLRRWRIEASLKLLIVDDNAAVRRLISKIVGLRPEEVGECADGSLALSLYEVHRPDLILMDICLVGMDGITATKQIKAAHPDARIVIVTNYDDDALRREAFLAGASDYVLKERLLHLRGVAESSLSGTQCLPKEDHSGKE